MKLKKVLLVAAVAIFMLSFVKIVNNERDECCDGACADNIGFIYDNIQQDYEDLFRNYVLMFSSADNQSPVCIQKNLKPNFVFARKDNTNKSFDKNASFADDLTCKIAGISRFELSFAALQSNHVLCYTLLFCRIQC